MANNTINIQLLVWTYLGVVTLLHVLVEIKEKMCKTKISMFKILFG